LGADSHDCEIGTVLPVWNFNEMGGDYSATVSKRSKDVVAAQRKWEAKVGRP
jgi:hypothetical protein